MGKSIVWLIVFVVTIIVEAMTVGLVSIWFTIGAIGGFIASLFTNDYLIQTAVFIIISILSLIVTRPIVKKILPKGVPKTNVNELIGKTALVTKELSDKKIGQVKVSGQIWSALNKEKEILSIDTEVEILSIEGVKLIVRKKDL